LQPPGLQLTNYFCRLSPVGFAKGREHGSQSGKGSITSIEKKEIKALGKFAFLPHVRVNPTSSTKFISPKILYLVTS
jgi:hypothetical protein